MADARESLVDGNLLAAKAFARAGVDHMFGVVGIPVTSFGNCSVSEGIRFIAFHNEQSAGYAASAYGYLTGKPGVLLTVSGPGCVHGLAGLSNAMINTWPMVLVSGSSDQADAGKGDFQELDQLAAVKPFAKCAVKATDIRKIPELVSTVVNCCVAGRPGGCYLDLPTDVLHQTLPYGEAADLLEAVQPFVPAWEDGDPSGGRTAVPEDKIETAVAALRGAQRPLVVFGKGAAYARAEKGLRDFVEITGTPFLPTPMGKGLIPDTHPLAATAARSLAIGQADVVLVVGARLNWLLHFGEPPRWSPEVKFILVDVSEEEIELRRPHVGIVGDARVVMEAMVREVKDDPFCLGGSHPWVEKVRAKAEDNVKKMSAGLDRVVVPFNFLTPMRIIRDAILSLGSPSPILVSEGANTMDVGRAVLVQTEPRTRLDAGTWGTMGVGLGYCIAAAVAEPKRLVVAVEGDSGFGFSGMEVETVVRYQLPVVVIVFNNGGVYGGDRRNPEDIKGPYKDDPAPTSFVPGAAYHTLMEAFGGKGYLVSTPEELQFALNESFSARRPALINVTIDPYAGAESGRMQHKN
ncbi:2-hydroxyacyl-CoA lyase [Nymphaea thermarum]|nr:2-hydroxyacyl-CoA lyase [Nymphaea thermarum]